LNIVNIIGTVIHVAFETPCKAFDKLTVDKNELY